SGRRRDDYLSREEGVCEASAHSRSAGELCGPARRGEEERESEKHCGSEVEREWDCVEGASGECSEEEYGGTRRCVAGLFEFSYRHAAGVWAVLEGGQEGRCFLLPLSFGEQRQQAARRSQESCERVEEERQTQDFKSERIIREKKIERER